MLPLLAGLCLLVPLAPAAAILPNPADTVPAQAGQPAQEIDTSSDAGADARIAARIRGIFSELPGLENVVVGARAGVVTLSGTVSETGASARAEAIAARVSGVVTVRNEIERKVSVNDGLDGLTKLKAKVDAVVSMLPLLGAAAALALAVAALGYLIAAPAGVWQRLARNSFLAELIASAIRFVFIVGGLVIALDMLGASALLGAVLGGAGVIGIALGFAMRDTIENYVASLMLSLRQPFRPNDHVVIDSHEGRVIRLTSRATILMTMDGNHLRIPNSAVFKAVILNYTRNPQRQFTFELGVDADDDPTEATRVGVEVLRGLPYVLKEPEPTGRVDQVGDSNIVLRFLAWIDQRETDFYKARSRAIPAVKDALEEAGFALPEPIYRLRFDAGFPLLPQGQGEQASEKPPVAPPRRRRADAGTASDTRPENEVARMVDQERSTPAGEKDLLDPSRPVE
ncbi:MscS mechanosensitive ion channel [Croceicoccus estronivorus]|nr:MscS mechanosensitive ion channel [Croceicoccus estronivorus]